jgi:hypothetical protein
MTCQNDRSRTLGSFKANPAIYCKAEHRAALTLPCTHIPRVHTGGPPMRACGERIDSLLNFLANYEVFCFVQWPLPNVPTSAALVLDQELPSQFLTLWIDERMEELQVLRSVKLIQQFFADHP